MEEVVANCDHLHTLRFSSVLPNASTEHGAVMLASVLNSKRAIDINIQIVRVFVQLRQLTIDSNAFRLEFEKMKKKHKENSGNI